MIQPREAAANDVTTDPASPVYVYGVVRADVGRQVDAIPGVGPEPAPVRAIEGGGTAALVSDLPPDWRAASRADVEAHDRVLTNLVADHTVVPMRFGIVMASDADVHERLLQPHEPELTSLLTRLDGRQQMSVKAFYLDEALLREVIARRPELKKRSDALEGLPAAASQDERIALGRDVAAAVEEQRALDEQSLVTPLASVADDIVVEPSVSERHAVTVQLLVARARRPQLDAAVQRLADEYRERLALRYVGPLPPYSFCAFSLDSEQPAWD